MSGSYFRVAEQRILSHDTFGTLFVKSHAVMALPWPFTCCDDAMAVGNAIHMLWHCMSFTCRHGNAMALPWHCYGTAMAMDAMSVLRHCHDNAMAGHSKVFNLHGPCWPVLSHLVDHLQACPLGGSHWTWPYGLARWN